MRLPSDSVSESALTSISLQTSSSIDSHPKLLNLQDVIKSIDDQIAFLQQSKIDLLRSQGMNLPSSPQSSVQANEETKSNDQDLDERFEPRADVNRKDLSCTSKASSGSNGSVSMEPTVEKNLSESNDSDSPTEVGPQESSSSSSKKSVGSEIKESTTQQASSSASLSSSTSSKSISSQSSSEKEVPEPSSILSGGSEIDETKAKDFLDFYCKRFKLKGPIVSVEFDSKGVWKTSVNVEGKQIGLSSFSTSREWAISKSFLKAAERLDERDGDLWRAFTDPDFKSTSTASKQIKRKAYPVPVPTPEKINGPDPLVTVSPLAKKVVTLSDGSKLNFTEAEKFMRFYCERYKFETVIKLSSVKVKNVEEWKCVLDVGGSRLGFGIGLTQEEATEIAYVDCVGYLEKNDPMLWKQFKGLLSNGLSTDYEEAKKFMKFYCEKKKLRDPLVTLKSIKNVDSFGLCVPEEWSATLTFGVESFESMETRSSQAGAKSSIYVHVVQSLEPRDPNLWDEFERSPHYRH